MTPPLAARDRSSPGAPGALSPPAQIESGLAGGQVYSEAGRPPGWRTGPVKQWISHSAKLAALRWSPFGLVVLAPVSDPCQN